MARKLIFCYGTLCANFHNHAVIKDKTTKFLGEAETSPNYTIYSGGFPIVEREGETSIKGEVYEINDDSVLDHVYQLEDYSGVPTKFGGNNWYDVDEIVTPFGIAEIFVQEKGQSGRDKVIPSGDWRKNNY